VFLSFFSFFTVNYLKETHEVIHRDIKPSNILLDDKGNVKVCRQINIQSISVNKIQHPLQIRNTKFVSKQKYGRGRQKVDFHAVIMFRLTET